MLRGTGVIFGSNFRRKNRIFGLRESISEFKTKNDVELSRSVLERIKKIGRTFLRIFTHYVLMSHFSRQTLA